MQALLDYLGFLRLDWMDLAEILVVSYLLYRVLLVYTGTRAFQVLIGFVLLVSIYVASQALQLRLREFLPLRVPALALRIEMQVSDSAVLDGALGAVLERRRGSG